MRLPGPVRIWSSLNFFAPDPGSMGLRGIIPVRAASVSCNYHFRQGIGNQGIRNREYLMSCAASDDDRVIELSMRLSNCSGLVFFILEERTCLLWLSICNLFIQVHILYRTEQTSLFSDY